MLVHAILSLSAPAAAALVAILILGGTSKGALGIGLPLISVPLTAQFLDLPVVIGLLTVPIIATNIGQVLESGGTVAALRRLWPMLLTVVAGTWGGVHLLMTIDRAALDAIVGAILVVLAVWLLCQPRIALSPAAEGWAGPLVGLAAGVLGGLSGMFGPPVIAYLVGLGVRPQEFVKYIAVVFLAASGTLLLALGNSGHMSIYDIGISAASLLPVQLGVVLGRWLRGRFPPAVFRALVLCVLAAGGLQMLRRGLF